VDKAGTQAAILDDNDFYPWGGIVPGVGKTTGNNTVKFTGQYRDAESQMDYFGARYYANVTGRFMSPDWAAKPTSVPYAELGDPQSLNLYSYVRNSPIVRVDANGHMAVLFSDRGDVQWIGGYGVEDGSGGLSGPADNRYDVTTTSYKTKVTYDDGTTQTLTQTVVTVQQVGSSTIIAQGYGSSRSTTTPATACYAQGRARIVGISGKGFKHGLEQAAMHIFRIKHMFWTVRGSDGIEQNLSGGPDGSILGEWNKATSEEGQAAYRDSGKIIYTAPQTADLCARVDAMESAVKHWPMGQINYSFFKGPNSNSSFNSIGQAGGMPILAPFWTPGARNVP
jgi:RHS repeat-associated protein